MNIINFNDAIYENNPTWIAYSGLVMLIVSVVAAGLLGAIQPDVSSASSVALTTAQIGSLTGVVWAFVVALHSQKFAYVGLVLVEVFGMIMLLTMLMLVTIVKLEVFPGLVLSEVLTFAMVRVVLCVFASFGGILTAVWSTRHSVA